VVEIFELH